MRRSIANPSLWGLTIKVPISLDCIRYRYVAYDTLGKVWVETDERLILFSRLSCTFEIEQEDVFENGIEYF
jgi:hypothetical protein